MKCDRSKGKGCNLSIVVLNYMNYMETVNCVDSILRQDNVRYHIVIVDNGSQNESFEYLKLTYKTAENIRVIKARQNYGFAKGNNIGIHYARKKWNSDCVLLLNSDTILFENDYLYNMLSEVRDDIGVVGSRIINRDGTEQLHNIGYVYFPATLWLYFCRLFFYIGWNGLSQKCKKKLQECKGEEILHGSNLLLTPQYFEQYDGLYERTFLYAEEEILFLRCQIAGLKQKKTKLASLKHIGKQSSRLLYKNQGSIREKYMLDSYKYVVLYSLKAFMGRKK